MILVGLRAKSGQRGKAGPMSHVIFYVKPHPTGAGWLVEWGEKLVSTPFGSLEKAFDFAVEKANRAADGDVSSAVQTMNDDGSFRTRWFSEFDKYPLPVTE